MARRRIVSAIVVSSILVSAALLALIPAIRTVHATNPAPYFWLPWQQNGAHQVWQGNGDAEHTASQGMAYAWDFGPTQGGPGSWPIRAARDGTVSNIRDNSTRGGCNGQLQNDANYVTVDTAGGYRVLYLHLLYGSVSGRLSLNQYVDRYTTLGITDTSGYACGAHLHYQVEGECGSWFCTSVPSSFVDTWVTTNDQNGVPLKYEWPVSSNNSFAILVAENSQYTWVARGSRLEKFDLGGNGPNMFSTSLDGKTGPHALGWYDMGAQITALAANDYNLFIGVDTGRVIKTDMCGNGPNPCQFSDSQGGGSLAGYSYWKGTEDFTTQDGIVSLAATSLNLYVGFDVGVGGAVSRTVKTTTCANGSPNMCALTSMDGTCCYDSNNWLGYQDWSTSVGAMAVNAGRAYIALAVRNSVCKTDIVGTGQNMFYLSDWPSSCTGGNASHYFGYQSWRQAPVSLSADPSLVWWSESAFDYNVTRVVQTNLCGSGANMCALIDDTGSGEVVRNPPYGYWIGRQDWCASYEGSGVTSNAQYTTTNQYVDSAMYMGSGIYRIVQARDGGRGVNGVNMFTSDCSGNMGSYVIGYQDLQI